MLIFVRGLNGKRILGLDNNSMTWKYKYIILKLIATLFGLSLVIGLDAASVGTEYLFRHFPDATGISAGQGIRCITQDSNGYIWIGTTMGLLRYDGFRTKAIDKASFGLTSNFITCLQEDKNGNIWIGTSHGICYYDYEGDCFRVPKLSDSKSPAPAYITSISCSPDGEIWFDDGFGRLLSCRAGEPIVEHILDGFDNTAKRIRYDGLSRLFVSAVLKGLYIYDHGEMKPISPEHNPEFFSTDDLTAVLPHPYNSDIVYISSHKNGFCEYEITSGRIRILYRWNPDQRPTSIAGDGVRNIFISTSNGLLRYDVSDDELRFIQHDPEDRYSLPEDFLTAVMCDKDGNIWLGTRDSGVYVSDVLKLGCYPVYRTDTGESLQSSLVTGFAQTSDGIVWVATQTMGLLRYDHANNTLTKGPEVLASKRIHSVCADDETLWVSSLDKLYKIQPSSGKIEQFDFYRVETLFRMSSGRIFAGALGGLYEWNREKHTMELRLPLEDKGTIVSMAEDAHGLLWCDTYSSGVFRYDPNSLSQKESYFLNEEEYGTGEMKSSVYADKRLGIWVTGRDGVLYHYDDLSSRFEHFDRSNTEHFPVASIMSALSDGTENLWLGTTSGIAIYDTKQKKATTVPASRSRLLNENFSEAALALQDGTMLFGYRDGFVRISPTLFASQENTPTIITELTVDGKPVYPTDDKWGIDRNVNITKVIRLQASNNSFSLSFSQPGWNAGPAYCKLEGVDQHNRDFSSTMQSNFYSVPPGTYTLKISGHKSIKVVIEPSFWRSAIGIALIACAFLIVLFSSVILVYRWEERKREEEAAMFKKRQNEEFLRNLETYVTKNLEDENFNVDALAEGLFMSRSTLTRRMKTLIDTTPIDYIKAKRMSVAKELLEEGNLTVSEVASKVGFAYPSYFSKCFKDAFGVPPTDLTRNYK